MTDLQSEIKICSSCKRQCGVTFAGGICKDCHVKPRIPTQVKSPTPVEKRGFYRPGTMEGRLEQHLIKKNISHIGDQNMMWDKYKCEALLEKNDMASFRWDMTPTERCQRTAHIKHLNHFQMRELHDKEVEQAGFIYPWHIFAALKLKKDELKIEGEEWAIIAEFNNAHRPPHDQTFEGFRVPPFFIYDCTFDPIEYHHAWDKNVWNNALDYKVEHKASIVDKLQRAAGEK